MPYRIILPIVLMFIFIMLFIIVIGSFMFLDFLISEKSREIYYSKGFWMFFKHFAHSSWLILKRLPKF